MGNVKIIVALRAILINKFKFANFPFEKEVLKKAGKKDIIATKNIGETL